MEFRAPAPTPQDSLARATLHSQHEADALYNTVLAMRLRDVSRGMPAHCIRFEGHRCSSRECTMIGKPPNQIVYVCPNPLAHPVGERNPDGSVLHRWSGDVFMCYHFGVPHVCTSSMCSHQISDHGELVCTLTGRTCGVQIRSVYELPFTFESGGKAMTAEHADCIDTAAVERRISSYIEKRPENAAHLRSVAAAAVDATQLPTSQPVRRLEICSAAVLDGSRTVMHNTLLEEAPLRRVLTITERLKKRHKPLAEPLVTQGPPPGAAAPRPFFALSHGPTESDIRGHFETDVSTLWRLLEQAYSPELRARELRAAEENMQSHCLDRRRAPRPGFTGTRSMRAAPVSHGMQFGELAALHAQMTHAAIEGMAYVAILAECRAWTDGTIRKKCVAELNERLWKLWTDITRSPKYRNCPEPHLYTRVSGAMLTMVVDGYTVSVCEVPHRSGKKKHTRYMQRCSHQKDATSVADCGHTKATLTLIHPHTMLQRLLGPEGMRRRVLHPVCGYTLGHGNSVVALLASLLQTGLKPAEIRQIVVGEANES